MLAMEGALLHSFEDAEGNLVHALVDAEGNLLHRLHDTEAFLINAEGDLVHSLGVAGRWLGDTEASLLGWLRANWPILSILLLIALLSILNWLSLRCCTSEADVDDEAPTRQLLRPAEPKSEEPPAVAPPLEVDDEAPPAKEQQQVSLGAPMAL